MPIRKLITRSSREYLDSDDIVMALLRTAADLEHLLFCKLFFEKRISWKLMKWWTLGTYIRWNIEMGLIGRKWEKALADFLRLRNLAVHERIFIDNAKKNKKALESIKRVVLSVCNLIDKTEVKYKSSQKLENEYGKFLNKNRSLTESYMK